MRCAILAKILPFYGAVVVLAVRDGENDTIAGFVGDSYGDGANRIPEFDGSSTFGVFCAHSVQV